MNDSSDLSIRIAVRLGLDALPSGARGLQSVRERAFSMKIIKKVVLPLTMDKAWQLFGDPVKLQGLWIRQTNPNTGIKAAIISKETWVVAAEQPGEFISYITDINNPAIVTSFELAPRGKGIELVVTIAGWRNIEPERARKEMPSVSLEWERRLNSLKDALLKSNAEIPRLR